MERETTYLLEDLIFDLTEIQASDVLAHMDSAKKDIFPVEDKQLAFPIDQRWNTVLKTTIQNKRQSDTDTLCLAVDGIEWEYKGKTVISPLWLVPASYKINKVKQEIELAPDFEQAIFNPFVKNELKRRYDLVWEENKSSELSQKSIELHDFLAKAELNFAILRFSVFGNFHHHRYQIVKDLEALTKVELNPLVQEMLGNQDAGKVATQDQLTKQNIVPADKDQQKVFEKIAHGNLVIQGPPGTGKSQVLTNLLAKLLLKGNMNLVVSEKKAALEVLVKKLSDHGLDAFAFISHNQTKPSDFISRLRKTWQLLETKMVQPEKNLLLSEQMLDQLQLTLDKLSSRELIGGIDLHTFKKLISEVDVSEIDYTSDVPSVVEWLNEKAEIEALSQGISSFKILSHFKQKGLQEILKLDQTLCELRSDFEKLSITLEFQTFAELETRISQVARCQILENEAYRKYAKLFSSKKERKKFEKLRIEFLKQPAIDVLRSEFQTWKTLPGLSQSQTWKVQLSGNWWQRRKAEKEIRSKLALPTVLPKIAVENWLQYLEQEKAFQDIISALHDLGIENTNELESIHYVLLQLEKDEANELNQVASLSPALRKSIVESGSKLQQRYRDLGEILSFDLADNVLKTIEAAIAYFPEILPVQQKIRQIPTPLYRLLQQHHSPELVEKIIFKSNWTQFESRFPELAKFDGLALKAAIEKISNEQSAEHQVFGEQLLFEQHQKFDQFHHLLRTPAAKLKADEKILKARLKAGKAILVKEFGKTKQHKTIRELLDSEARTWIEILMPIWLSTPTQVASSFPMETALFECVIFDEASQIPLSHALGSLQRAKRAVVAGDEQQMSPGNYFSGITSGVDLLHQAGYYWPKSPLRHHYRSIHPELIAFSNRFFYNNELIAYPSADRGEEPLKLHYIPGAVYDDRQNIAEAKAVASQIETWIHHPDSLGIVAFTEQQLDCIWKQLPASLQQALTQRMEDGTAFFKALEQVQGDECDRLMISFGYGKNPDGTFHLRFGPLNQKNGSKRLNVLFSRAKKAIDFYTSIEASDLSLSANEAVNLLRFFLSEAESDMAQKEIAFPFGLKPEMKGNVLEFENIAQHLPNAKELAVLHAVLKNRGWEINF